MLSFLLLPIGKESDPHTNTRLKSVTSALWLNFGSLGLWSLPKDRLNGSAEFFTGSTATVTEFPS